MVARKVIREKNSFDFTMNWALKNNEPIKDLKDFTATFFSQQTLTGPDQRNKATLQQKPPYCCRRHAVALQSHLSTNGCW